MRDWFRTQWRRVTRTFTPPRILRGVLVAILLAALIVGLGNDKARNGDPSPVGIELAGNANTFNSVLAGRGPSLDGGKHAPPKSRETNQCFIDGSLSRPCTVRAAQRGITRDFWFILDYTLAFSLLCALGAAATARTRRSFLYGMVFAAVAAGLADCAENEFLRKALEHSGTDKWAQAATVASTAKWALLVPVVVGAVVGMTRFVARGAVSAATEPLPPELDRESRWLPPSDGKPISADATDVGWEPLQRGISLSGGGIRSASFSLGVLQRLEEGVPEHGSALGRARYLTAVSGGGYIAGAAQLHASLQGTSTAFAAGSPEEDHLRRHASYLTDGAAEWVRALSSIIGKLLVNLLLIAGVVFALAQPAGWIGRFLLDARLRAVNPGRQWPHIATPTWLGFALLAVPAFVFAVAHRRHVVVNPANTKLSPRIRSRTSGAGISLAIGFGAGAGVLGLTAIVLPYLDAAGVHLADQITGQGWHHGAAVGGWATALLTAALSAVAGKALKGQTTTSTSTTDASAPSGIKKYLSMNLFFAKNPVQLLVGPLLALVAFAYFCAFAAAARASGPRGVAIRLGHKLPFASSTLFLVIGGAVLIFITLMDAVTWSMHKFYKRRLWSAFTYDPATRDERAWSTSTILSEHGERIDARPELVLCGAAEVSGPELAPARERAVTWTFDANWVGGPEIGWCSTTDMESALAQHNMGADLTMFGAIAIAGAAFGSAMGRQSMGTINSVFAIANARLGVWLPNPRQVANSNLPASSTPPGRPIRTWTYRLRNLRYLGREIFGRYAADASWILVADGGHHENLGVVELFRRRCRQVLCFDASGDASGALTTIAEALRTAEAELGVIVTVVADPWADAPGHGSLGPAPKRLVDVLADRLADSPFVIGKIHYPREAWADVEVPVPAVDIAVVLDGPPDPIADAMAGAAAEVVAKAIEERLLEEERAELDEAEHDCWIIIGRSVLDRRTPFHVLSYAAGDPDFPNDSTANQWFTGDLFDDYRMLGRHVAEEVLVAAERLGWFIN